MKDNGYNAMQSSGSQLIFWKNVSGHLPDHTPALLLPSLAQNVFYLVMHAKTDYKQYSAATAGLAAWQDTAYESPCVVHCNGRDQQLVVFKDNLKLELRRLLKLFPVAASLLLQGCE